MSGKIEATEKEREKHIKKDMEKMKKRYDTVNEKLGKLETRIDKMGKDQAESSCAIQFKLDALLRNSIAQDKSMVENHPELELVSWNHNKRNGNLYR